MDYLTELTHGLGAIRGFLDKKFPAWKTAEVSVSLEPHHAMMELKGIAEDQKIETFDVMLIVGTMEDLDPTKEPAMPIIPRLRRIELVKDILTQSKRMEALVDESVMNPDPERRKLHDAEANRIANYLLLRQADDPQFKAVYNQLLEEGKLTLQYLKEVSI